MPAMYVEACAARKAGHFTTEELLGHANCLLLPVLQGAAPTVQFLWLNCRNPFFDVMTILCSGACIAEGASVGCSASLTIDDAVAENYRVGFRHDMPADERGGSAMSNQ